MQTAQVPTLAYVPFIAALPHMFYGHSSRYSLSILLNFSLSFVFRRWLITDYVLKIIVPFNPCAYNCIPNPILKVCMTL